MQVAAALMAACLSVTALSDGYAAGDAVKLYDVSIARQPLDAALKELARQTGLQVGRFTDVRGSGPVVGPLSGKYSVDHALQSLLESSGLTYQPLNDRAFIVLAPREVSSQTGDSRCFTDCDPSTTDCSNKQTGEDMGNQVHCAKMSYLVAGVLGTTMMVGNGAYAQTAGTPSDSKETVGLEEIIVTAQRREENLQRAALAVTAVTGETLDAVNAENLFDVARVAPNIQFGSGYGGGSALFVRGIGQQQDGLLSDPGAVIYIDGVYRPRVAGNSTNFSDVERLEVLRGPQGTLFGKNAIGGALNIVSKAPDNDFDAAAEVQGGSRNRIKAGGSINIPLVQDRLATRLSFDSNKQDGYMHNLETGKELNDTNYYTARASLLWTLSEDFSITLRGDYTDQDQNGTGTKAISVPNPIYLTAGKYETRGTAPTYARATDTGYSGTIDWNVGPGAFKSITAARHWTLDYARDSDGTPDPINMLGNTSDVTENFISQEIQYNTKLINERLDLTVGAFYMDEHVLQNEFPRQAWPPRFLNQDTYRDQNTKGYAVFSQGTFALTDKFNLTAGARYSSEKKDASLFAYNNVTSSVSIDKSLSDEYSAFTPKVTLDYKITPDAMVYATASKGFKAGGFNGLPTNAAGFAPFGPEYVWNYELGFKSEWLDRRLRANFAAYRMDYTDIQLNANVGYIVVTNAGQARIDGFEAEFSFLATPALLLNASYGYNDFTFTQLDPGAAALGMTLNTELPNAPKNTVNGGVQYTVGLGHSGEIVLRTDYAWRAKTYFDTANTAAIVQDSYGLWSARVTYTSASGVWSVFGYGTNLSDTYYHTTAGTSYGNVYSVPAPPREVGLGFKIRFGQ